MRETAGERRCLGGIFILLRAWLPTLAVLLGLQARAAEVRLGGGPGWSLGSVGVSGIETGIGGGVEGGAYFGSGRSAGGFFLTVDVAGYVGSGDGDPILSGSAEGRYRRFLAGPDDRVRPYVAAGGGLGLVILLGVGASVFGEAGVDWSRPGGPHLGIALRERLAFIGSGGSPPAEPLNTIQLVASLGWRFRG
jgi:hypothetical protein